MMFSFLFLNHLRGPSSADEWNAALPEQQMCSEHLQREKKKTIIAAWELSRQWNSGEQDRPRSPWSGGGPLTPRLHTINGRPVCANRGIFLCGCCCSVPKWCSTLCDTMNGSPPGSSVLWSSRPDRQLITMCWRPARGGGRPSWIGLEGDPADGQGSRHPGPCPRPGKPLEQSSVEGPSRASRMRVKQSLDGQAAAKSRRKHTPSAPGAKKARPVGSTRGRILQVARSHTRSEATGLCLLSGGRSPTRSTSQTLWARGPWGYGAPCPWRKHPGPGLRPSGKVGTAVPATEQNCGHLDHVWAGDRYWKALPRLGHEQDGNRTGSGPRRRKGQVRIPAGVRDTSCPRLSMGKARSSWRTRQLCKSSESQEYTPRCRF